MLIHLKQKDIKFSSAKCWIIAVKSSGITTVDKVEWSNSLLSKVLIHSHLVFCWVTLLLARHTSMNTHWASFSKLNTNKFIRNLFAVAFMKKMCFVFMKIQLVLKSNVCILQEHLSLWRLTNVDLDYIWFMLSDLISLYISIACISWIKISLLHINDLKESKRNLLIKTHKTPFNEDKRNGAI